MEISLGFSNYNVLQSVLFWLAFNQILRLGYGKEDHTKSGPGNDPILNPRVGTGPRYRFKD